MAKKIKPPKDSTDEAGQKAEEAARAAAGIQDEFQARGFELMEWVQEKQKFVLGFLAVVIGGGLAFGIYNVVTTNRNASASADLQRALEAFDAPVGDDKPDADGLHYKDAAERTKAAHDLFLKAAEGHAGTGAAAVAHLYAGHTALKMGQYEEAAKEYQAYLDGSSKDDPLRFAGLSGRATALEAKGDKKGAVQELEALVALPDKIDEDAALLELGRLYQDQGNTASARAALERIAKDFPESPLKTRADERLATLGGPTPGAAAKKDDLKGDGADDDAP